MKAAGHWASKRLLVAVTIGVIAVLLLSMMISTSSAVSAVAPQTSTTPAPSAQTATTSAATAHSSAATATKAAVESAASTTPYYDQPSAGGGPHPGTLEGYEVAAEGATTEDPAIAYDTVSFEPILNVYQTLIAYNGSSTSNFVPELSTCVPGLTNGVSSTPSVSCEAVYGQSLVVSNSAGEPEYYTFPIDPAAHFYDPSTGVSWKVYPSDVMFSLARTMSFADLPGVAINPGWIQTQSLLPNGNPAWDSGIHSPYNNTPNNVLDSMLINDSTYCPAAALAQSGCITFNAFGGGVDWPFFLELVSDPLGAGVVPCGWFTYEDAGVPGFPGTSAAKGDGPCLLPGGVTSTSDAAFGAAVGAMSPTSWDAFQELTFNRPAVQPNVRWSLVGSGPYYVAAFDPTGGYTLEVNPAYQQPTGCKGVGGGCDPAIGAYIPKIVIVFEATDTEGIEQAVAGQTDYFEFDSPETSTVLQLASEGKIGIQYATTLSIFFFPFNLNWSASLEPTIDPYAGTTNVATSFFASNTVREFLAHAYPYTTIENTAWVVDGVSYGFNFGGSIPYGMADYYPTNISWPYQGGDPGSNTSVNSAAWWWTQGRTVGSPYYDPQLAACTPTTPCKFPIVGSEGEPQSGSFDIAIAAFISSVESITGNAVQPYVFYQSFTDRVVESEATPGNDPMPFYQLAWAPDYPDPTDYLTAMYGANGTYTLGDSTYQVLEVNASYNLASCGHTADTWADLIYWANYWQSVGTPIPTGCQGPAYGQMLYWMSIAASQAPGAYRVLLYNEVEHIENQLALYIWADQENTVLTYAKWINPAGINQNVMIGGGMDQTWYTWSYATQVSNVYFNETGLAPGTSWSVRYAGATYTNGTSNSILIPDQTIGNYSYSVGYVPGYTQSTSVNGTVTVAPPAPYSVTVNFAAVSPACTAATCGTVTYAEGGLVSGTTWTVVMAGLGSETGYNATLSFPDVVVAGSPYDYGVVTAVGYNTTTPTNGQGTVTVLATGTSVAVFFTGVLFNTYPVYLVSSGLAGGSWSVKMNLYNNTTTSPTIVFWEANGTYPFVVSTTSGLTPIATQGQTTVNGSAVTIDVPFTSTPETLTFTETGLATAVNWGVTLVENGTNPQGGTSDGFTVPSSTTTAVFQVAAGLWNWSTLPLSGWITSPTSGNVTVSTAAVGVTIPYTLVTYAVTVFEVGLPTGASWLVNATYTFPGSTETNFTAVTSTSVTLVLYLPNGTAQYTVTGPTPIYTSPAGSITVTAAPGFAVAVFTITPTTYSVTFSQTGVPSGDTWTVWVNGVEKNSTGASVAFALSNGTYTYVLAVPSGYTATPSGGSVSVVGAAQTVSFSVAPTPSVTSTALSSLAYGLIAAFAVLAVIFLITTVYFARRKPPAANPPQSWQSTSGGSSSDSMATESKDDSSSTPPSS